MRAIARGLSAVVLLAEHLGLGFFHREDGGQTDASGPFAGITGGVTTFSPTSDLGGMFGATAFIPVRGPERNPASFPSLIVPLFARVGVVGPR